MNDIYSTVENEYRVLVMCNPPYSLMQCKPSPTSCLDLV